MPTVLRTRFPPDSYTQAQLRLAVRLVERLRLMGRGDFVLLEDPEDA